MRKRVRIFGIGAGVAAVAAALIIITLSPTLPDNRAQAAEVLAQAADAASNLQSIHIKGQLRTRPHDNFSMIGSRYDFVPMELWKEFGENGRWRIEKPGRVLVMDGESTVMLIRPKLGVKINRSTRDAFDTYWFHHLADVGQSIMEELRSAMSKGWDLDLISETTSDGKDSLVVTVEIRSELPADDYAKNASLGNADLRRVYRFDAETRRLESINIYLRQKPHDVLIFEATQIEYDPEIDPSVFTLDLPEDVIWYEKPGILPDNEKYQQMTPAEAARAFFEACGREDWDEVRKIWNYEFSDRLKEHLGGLEIISIGTPFKSAGYTRSGWFVPYEIKFKDGRVKKFNLALRKDNPAKRYVFDGGL